MFLSEYKKLKYRTSRRDPVQGIKLKTVDQNIKLLFKHNIMVFALREEIITHREDGRNIKYIV